MSVVYQFSIFWMCLYADFSHLQAVGHQGSFLPFSNRSYANRLVFHWEATASCCYRFGAYIPH